MPKAASGFLEDEGSFESNSWQVCWVEKGQHSALNLSRYQQELLADMAELLNTVTVHWESCVGGFA